MAACWPLQMPPTAKAVLISLADNANDAGHCWPSLTTIAERTCVSRRAVIDAVDYLERAGAVARVRGGPGRSTYYQITPAAFNASVRQESARKAARDADMVQMPHQGKCRTRANAAPTSANAALDMVQMPHPNRKENRQEPPVKQSARARAPAVERPSDVAEVVWDDFLQLRRVKRAPMTQTALDGIRREAERAGVTLGHALSVCCERGWQGFRADWYGQANASQPPRAAPSPRRSAAVEAGLALAGFTRNSHPETIDVAATELAAPRLG